MAGAERAGIVELTIGQLASMSRLTVRALHHYDHVGLLHPARIEPTNGYRYYDPSQIVTASTIAVLRGLDLDIESIRQVLDGSRDLDEVLEAERVRREREARRAAAGLAVLESLMGHGDNTNGDHPRMVDVSDFELVGKRLAVPFDDDIERAAIAFDELFTAAKRSGLGHDPDSVCLIRGSRGNELHLDIGVRPIEQSVTPPSGYRTITVDGGPTASLLHRGPLESLPITHAHLNSWILEQGFEPMGDARETYLGDLAEQRTQVEIGVSSLPPVSKSPHP